jgi:hypothetical protein
MRLLAAFAFVCLAAAPAAAFECPPPGYDGNSDCGYQCGEGGTCCGNPHYYGSYIFGTWYPDPRCVKPVKRSKRRGKRN